ncbi:MAG TPA: hypothetical protein VKE88_03515 [Candidatus Nanoarchaeia archaeon]|nr:hypothetical protein [Candidatus Nanoarchaeia archaeon]
MDDDYTLLSSKEVSELKQDMDYLKKNPLGGTKSGKSLQESIDKLNENMEMLIEIFKEASDQMKAEERESDVILKRIQPLENKLEELSEQNQKIAKGILAVADMVAAKEQAPPMQKPRPMMMPPMAPRPPMPGMQAPQRMPPMPNAPTFSQPSAPSLPPPPMPRKEDKGMFGFLKK